MNPQNRDLLLLTNKETLDPLELEHEIELIIDILHKVEMMVPFALPMK